MELREVIRVSRRWWWLLLLGPVAAGGVALAWSVLQPAEYQAEATLLVNSIGEPGTLGADAPRGGQDLARTYQELVRTWPVLEPVIDELNLAVDVEQLRDRVGAEVINGTQLLRISATDSRPQAAADLANAAASSFVQYIGQQRAEPFRASQSEITDQLHDIRRQVEEIGTQLEALGPAGDTTTILDLRANLEELQATRARLLVQMREIDLSVATAASHVSVATAARPPVSRSSPPPLFVTLIGAFAGLLVAVGALALFEYLDDARA